MTTQIISHHADNQLFATRQQALNEIKRNNYQVIDTMCTLPCSFDERQRNRYDLNRDDEMAINVYVIETEDDEPMLIGYMSDGVKLYLVNTYEAYMASEEGITAFVNEPNDTIDSKHEILEEEEIELPDGYTFDGEDIVIGNEIAELVTQQEDNGDYVTYLISSQSSEVLHNWGKY